MESRKAPTIAWQWYKFNDLSAVNCYKFLQLRARIFIEEQGYAYNDLDDLDFNALHLLGFDTSATKNAKDRPLIAYARLFFPEPQTVEVSRVVVQEAYRKSGVGSTLMHELLHKIDHNYPHYKISLKVGVDENYKTLPKFYKKFGFELAENQQPKIYDNYVYKNFDYPLLEMTRPAQHKAIPSSCLNMANHFLGFFKHHKISVPRAFARDDAVKKDEVMKMTNDRSVRPI